MNLVLPTIDPWPEGQTLNRLTNLFTGYGTTRSNKTALTLSPAEPASPQNTHSALVVTEDTFGPNVTITATTVLVRQHRTAPNPWEAPWITWAHHGGPFGISGGLTTVASFNYLAIKTNGIEMGTTRPDGAGGQQFLFTREAPVIRAGARIRFRVRQEGQRVRVWVLHRLRWVLVADVASGLWWSQGSVGFYCEDATVQFLKISIK